MVLLPVFSEASRIISHRETTPSEDCARCIISFNSDFCRDSLQSPTPEYHCCDLQNTTDTSEPFCQSNQLWYYFGDKEN